jgi:hypothetical protein
MGRFGFMCGIWCPGGFSCDSIHLHVVTELPLQSQTNYCRPTNAAVQRPAIVFHQQNGQVTGTPVALSDIRALSRPCLQTGREPMGCNQSDSNEAAHASRRRSSSNWR